MSNAFTVRVSAGRVALLGLMTAGLVASGSAVAFADTAAPAAPAWHHHHHHHMFWGFGPYAGGRHFDNHKSYHHHHHHWYEHKLETWKGGDDTDNRGLDTRRDDDNYGFGCGCGDDRFRRDGFRDGHDGVREHAVTPGDASAGSASVPAAPSASAAAPADAPATAPAASTPAESPSPVK